MDEQDQTMMYNTSYNESLEITVGNFTIVGVSLARETITIRKSDGTEMVLPLGTLLEAQR